MRRPLFSTIPLILLLGFNASATERLLFTAGWSRQLPSGGIRLENGSGFNAGAGVELVDDLFALLRFGFPAEFQASAYPLYIDINGVDSAHYFRKYAIFYGQVIGQYTFRAFDESRFAPKLFGGLGLYWLYNTKKSKQYPDVTFKGLGPEFGLGGVYEFSHRFWADFTFSIRFPYYMEYLVSGHPKTAIGLDQQIVCFNLALYYIHRLNR